MKRLVLTAALAIALTACATSIPVETRSTITKVLVVNEMPAAPNYTHIGTTVFSNDLLQADDPSLKDVFTAELVGLLKAKGYNPEVADSLSAASTATPTIEIIPLEIEGLPRATGYGYHQWTLLGIKPPVQVYAAVGLKPKLNGKEYCVLTGCAGITRSLLSSHDMPPTWNDLSGEQKATYRAQLEANIKKAINKAFQETKL